MKSARIASPNEPLVIEESETPVPRGVQVLLEVKSAGVCHSDLHLWEGGYSIGDGQFLKVTDRGVRYPVTPGHEVVGVVKEVGEDVIGSKPGDLVLVYPWAGCGRCPACSAGSENLCDTPKSIGLFQDGGYADHIMIPSYKYLAKLDGIDPDAATSLACSGLTAYTAVKKADHEHLEFALVIGAGGLGLMGIQIAKAITNAKIICADYDDDKLKAATDMGADHTINSKDPGTAQKIMEITGQKGVDSVIDFVNAPSTVSMALGVIRKRGRIVLVGLFGGSAKIPLVSIPLKSLTIQGAYTGSYSDMVEILDLARRGIINPVISRRYTLDEANTALEDLKQRKIVGRAVINPG